MFSERRVSASIDRILCEPDVIASQSVKTIRKRLEAELNVTFDTKERSIVKKILTMKIQKKIKREKVEVEVMEGQLLSMTVTTR